MVGILILNYNNTKDIKECIDSIVDKIDLSAVKLLVVDNGSTKDNYLNVGCYLKEKFKNVQEVLQDDTISNLAQVSYLRLERNLGYARGNNAGLEFLYRDSDVNYVMVLNSDIIITEDFLPILKDYIKMHDNVAVVSPLLYNREGEIDHCCARKALSKDVLIKTFSYLQNKEYLKALHTQKILKQNKDINLNIPIDIELPSGSCMMFKNDILQKIGGFDPNTFLYYEENILYRKINNIGMKCVLLPMVSCIHTGGATTTSMKTAYFLKKCNYESVLYYLKTYEKCSRIELYYVIITAYLRLFRLWLGKKYKEIFKNR